MNEDGKAGAKKSYRLKSTMHGVKFRGGERGSTPPRLNQRSLSLIESLLLIPRAVFLR